MTCFFFFHSRFDVFGIYQYFIYRLNSFYLTISFSIYSFAKEGYQFIFLFFPFMKILWKPSPFMVSFDQFNGSFELYTKNRNICIVSYMVSIKYITILRITIYIPHEVPECSSFFISWPDLAIFQYCHWCLIISFYTSKLDHFFLYLLIDKPLSRYNVYLIQVWISFIRKIYR